MANKKIELSQEEIETLLVSLETLSENNDAEDLEQFYGLDEKVLIVVGKKLYDQCDNTETRWEWEEKE